MSFLNMFDEGLILVLVYFRTMIVLLQTLFVFTSDVLKNTQMKGYCVFMYVKIFVFR